METQCNGIRKRKSFEGGPNEAASSEYKTPFFEKKLDDQDGNIRLPEAAVKGEVKHEHINFGVCNLPDKFTPGPVDIDDDLVKQHAKVAEEAIAGWEKAEIEAMVLKQRLEAFAKENVVLEDRANHLDDALKEVVKQLRDANEVEEQKFLESMVKKTKEWELTNSEFQNQIIQLQSQLSSYKAEASSMSRKLEFAEKENLALKLELSAQSDELEIRTIERDLSTQVAENASKQNLESIKKVARLEAECRRLRCTAHTSFSDHKSGAGSFYVDSLTDSQSDNGERLLAADIDFQSISLCRANEFETSCSSSRTSAVTSGLHQSKSMNIVNKNRGSSGIEMDLMDDFLEIERLAALPEIIDKGCQEPETFSNNQSSCDDNSLEEARSRASKLEEKIDLLEAEKAVLEEKLEKTEQQKAELNISFKQVLELNLALEDKVKRIEAERAKLETALTDSKFTADALHAQLREAGLKLNNLQKELSLASESQESCKSQVMGYELEAKIMSVRVESLESALKKEKDMSADLILRCDDTEDELFRTKQELELLQSTISNSQLKIKQDDLAAAAGKLVECQQTIASLGVQLKSLASLDDFITGAANSQQSTEVSDISEDNRDHSRILHSNALQGSTCSSVSPSGTNDNSPASSSSSSSTSSVTKVSIEKSKTGFTNLFSRSNRGKLPTRREA